MRLGRKLSIVLAIPVILLAAACFYSGPIAVYLVEKTCDLERFQTAYDIDINYKKSSLNFSRDLLFKDLSIISRKTGFGFICRNARIGPLFGPRNAALNFDLQDVNFAKETKEKDIRYDTIGALIATPFDNRWKYSHIRGRIEPAVQRIGIKDFELLSDDIRLIVNGDLFYNGTIESDIVIYFSPTLTAKIPPELANALLTGEKDGWMSLSVRVAGDPGKPAIQVSSKLFRLNIKAVSGT
ncbi:MAG: hypothetical protein WC522_02990 [Candidatus Omnitrophota bacterium]